MSNLVPMEEAARVLGMSLEDLSEARSRGDIHAYRDGKTWKFKQQEIERYKTLQVDVTDAHSPTDSVIRAGSSAIIDAELDELVDVGETSGLRLNDDVIDDDHIGVVSSSSSTIIGKSKLADELNLNDEVDLDQIELDAKMTGESSLTLDQSSGIALSDGSGIQLFEEEDVAQEGNLDESDEDVQLSDSSELNLVESSIKLGGGSDIFAMESGDADDAAATGDLGKAAAALEDDDDIVLDSEQPQLELSDEDLELSLGSSSEISLDADDLDLAASDTGVSVADGSDVTLDAGGSGINLSAPGDSGISLDRTPPELALGGGEVLELGEAEFADFDDALIDDDALQADDDFLLSPSESDMGEEDSGSQVIALDTEELDDDAATLVGGDDTLGAYGDADDQAMAPLAGVGAAGSESAYSIVNVLTLGMTCLPLALTGLFLFDLVRNMWSWNGPYELNSGIMNFILQMFG